MQKNILIVDDELVQLKLLEKIVGDLGYGVLAMDNGQDVVDFFTNKKVINNFSPNKISVMLIDLSMPDVDGLTVLKQIFSIKGELQIIVLTADNEVSSVISALNFGANDYIIKGERDVFVRIIASINNSIEKKNLKHQVCNLEYKNSYRVSFSDLIGDSEDFIEMINIAKKAINSNVPVLIQGDLGVGKELLAKAIHCSSVRSGKPFISVDCNYLNNADVVLFGNNFVSENGVEEKSMGKIKEANGGTLFLDNVNCLRSDTQVKLLRFIQEGVVKPSGSSFVNKVNVRIISSTIKDLKSHVRCRRFREDLYYCLNIFPITMPSLLERGRMDIKLLAENFCRNFSANENKKIKGLSDAALNLIYRYDWSSNVRQLKSYVFRAVVLCTGTVLKPEHFPQILDSISSSKIKKKRIKFWFCQAKKCMGTFQNTLEDLVWGALKKHFRGGGGQDGVGSGVQD